jgi:lysophospholipase L1-like esterase
MNNTTIPEIAPRRWSWRTVVHGCCLLLTLLMSVEVSARVEDRFRSGVPLFSTPDRVADLVVQDALGVRGKPNGRYKHWKLNAFGFRGPEIGLSPKPGCTRVMTLGASETFGLYESLGNEYPAQLGNVLRESGCYEVVNGAIFGLTVPDIRKSWNNWTSRFRPAIVTIYPSPSFYLAPSPPGPAAANTAPFPRPPWWQPRSLERARDVINYPDFIQRRRVARGLAEIDAAHDPSWFFRTVPQDRIGRYERDLTALVQDVKASGARVILMTHATGFRRPVAEADMLALEGWRQILGRPTTDVLLEFEAAARDVTSRVAATTGVEVVDVAAQLNGEKQVLAAGDLLHFNDEGAMRVATLVKEAILSQSNERKPVLTTR